jgi:hypothetical protein
MLGGAVKRVWIAALAGVVVVGGVACGGDDGEQESTGSTASSTTAAPTTTTTADPRVQVEEAYLAYWDAYLKASMDPVDPHLTELQDRMTGDQKRATTRNLENMRATGQAVSRPVGARHMHAVIDVRVQGHRGLVDACSVDDLVTYEVATGRPIDDSVATKQYEASLILERGAWKVALITETQRIDGVVPCPG